MPVPTVPLPNLTLQETQDLAEWRAWLLDTARRRGVPASAAPSGDVEELATIIRKFHGLASETEVPLPGWIATAAASSQES